MLAGALILAVGIAGALRFWPQGDEDELSPLASPAETVSTAKVEASVGQSPPPVDTAGPPAANELIELRAVTESTASSAIETAPETPRVAEDPSLLTRESPEALSPDIEGPDGSVPNLGVRSGPAEQGQLGDDVEALTAPELGAAGSVSGNESPPDSQPGPEFLTSPELGVGAQPYSSGVAPGNEPTPDTLTAPSEVAPSLPPPVPKKAIVPKAPPPRVAKVTQSKAVVSDRAPDPLVDVLAEIEAMEQQGRLSEAAVVAELRLQTQEDPRLRRALIRVAAKAGDADRVQRAAAALPAVEMDEQTRVWVGYGKLQGGNASAAKDDFQAVLGANRTQVMAWLYLGLALQDLGRHADAVNAFRAARDLAPDMPEIAYNAGLSWWQLGDQGRARAAFTHFLKVTESKRLHYSAQRDRVQAIYLK